MSSDTEWSTTCVWKFNTEADLRIVLGVTDITKDATDTITLRDSNGDILPTTSVAVGTREGFKIVTSTGNSISIQLDTDDSSNDEEIYIYVISGVDSGTCPGNSKISATDEYQIITSSNFPDNYNEMEVCTVSITADENKVISYEILFKHIQDSTDFDECGEIFEVFDGSTLENRIFDTCNSFLPGRLSKLKTTSVGRTLDLRFVSSNRAERSGFVLLFKQEEKCLPRKSAFHNNIDDRELSEADYYHTQLVWKTFETSRLGDYHDLFMETDVIRLADVFENFSNICLRIYGLNPAQFYTAPGLA
uniref:CUB domain-containing protein n=1 Tax=Magallana gigas TaxID=29159 RepID=A0A8W8M8E9_MAGGI